METDGARPHREVAARAFADFPLLGNVSVSPVASLGAAERFPWSCDVRRSPLRDAAALSIIAPASERLSTRNE
jgi:hypothetical protein